MHTPSVLPTTHTSCTGEFKSAIKAQVRTRHSVLSEDENPNFSRPAMLVLACLVIQLFCTSPLKISQATWTSIEPFPVFTQLLHRLFQCSTRCDTPTKVLMCCSDIRPKAYLSNVVHLSDALVTNNNNNNYVFFSVPFLLRSTRLITWNKISGEKKSHTLLSTTSSLSLSLSLPPTHAHTDTHTHTHTISITIWCVWHPFSLYMIFNTVTTGDWHWYLMSIKSLLYFLCSTEELS